jgi:hypothetical protein
MDAETRIDLIKSLEILASEIEKSPPPIIGSDIFVQTSNGGSAIGSSISITAGSGANSMIGERITVVANKPGQTVIGKRITMVAGDGPAVAPPSGASSAAEIDATVQQLIEAANTLRKTDASKGWIQSLLDKASSWGTPALSGAISGASNALVRFYFTGS